MEKGANYFFFPLLDFRLCKMYFLFSGIVKWYSEKYKIVSAACLVFFKRQQNVSSALEMSMFGSDWRWAYSVNLLTTVLLPASDWHGSKSRNAVK